MFTTRPLPTYDYPEHIEVPGAPDLLPCPFCLHVECCCVPDPNSWVSKWTARLLRERAAGIEPPTEPADPFAEDL